MKSYFQNLTAKFHFDGCKIDILVNTTICTHLFAFHTLRLKSVGTSQSSIIIPVGVSTFLRSSVLLYHTVHYFTFMHKRIVNQFGSLWAFQLWKLNLWGETELYHYVWDYVWNFLIIFFFKIRIIHKMSPIYYRFFFFLAHRFALYLLGNLQMEWRRNWKAILIIL